MKRGRLRNHPSTSSSAPLLSSVHPVSPPGPFYQRQASVPASYILLPVGMNTVLLDYNRAIKLQYDSRDGPAPACGPRGTANTTTLNFAEGEAVRSGVSNLVPDGRVFFCFSYICGELRKKKSQHKKGKKGKKAKRQERKKEKKKEFCERERNPDKVVDASRLDGRTRTLVRNAEHGARAVIRKNLTTIAGQN